MLMAQFQLLIGLGRRALPEDLRMAKRELAAARDDRSEVAADQLAPPERPSGAEWVTE